MEKCDRQISNVVGVYPHIQVNVNGFSTSRPQQITSHVGPRDIIVRTGTPNHTIANAPCASVNDIIDFQEITPFRILVIIVPSAGPLRDT